MGRPYLRDVQLGNPSHIGGETYLFDDFEASVLRWTAVAGSNGTLARITSDAYNGSACMSFTQSSAQAGSAVSSAAQRLSSLPPPEIWSVDWWMRFFTSNSNNVQMGLEINAHAGGTQSFMGLRVNKSGSSTGAIQVRTASGTWSSLPGIDFTNLPNPDSWMRCTLVIDQRNLVYKKVRVGWITLDTSDLVTITTGASTSQQVLDQQIFIDDSDDNGSVVRIDNYRVVAGDIILSQDLS